MSTIHVKRVELKPGSYMNLTNPLIPATWTVTVGNVTKPIREVSKQELSMIQCHFLDIGYDCHRGTREYIDVQDLPGLLDPPVPVSVLSEDMVKREREKNPALVIQVARYIYSNQDYSDYTILDELRVGRNQLLLSNESCLLKRGGRALDSNFQNISLIVNCHMQSVPVDYYAVPCRVMCHAVHQLSRMPAHHRMQVFLEINEAIWEGLQTGTVVVHCLAGVHRASCVVVSHMLYRHFVKGQTYLSSDILTNYAGLAKIRRGVEPLGYIDLVRDFRNYLVSLTSNPNAPNKGK